MLVLSMVDLSSLASSFPAQASVECAIRLVERGRPSVDIINFISTHTVTFLLKIDEFSVQSDKEKLLIGPWTT